MANILRRATHGEQVGVSAHTAGNKKKLENVEETVADFIYFPWLPNEHLTLMISR